LDTFGINVKRLMLTLFVVFPLVGCLIIPTSARTYHTVYEPQCCPNQGPARLITKEEAAHITETTRGIDVVELTNKQFKIQVYYDGLFRVLNMRLIVPAGEELSIIEPFAEIFDTATHQQLGKFDVSWFHEDSQLDDDTGRLIGLISSPPVTIYRFQESFHVERESQEENYIDLKLPVFRTKGNETTKFDDVMFKISTAPDEYNGGYHFIPLFL
jgi:hypothetical protein